MRYFDIMLSEALNAPELTGDALYAEIERLFGMWGKEKDPVKKDAIADEVRALQTDNNKDEWEQSVKKIGDRNIGNKQFKKAMKSKARRGDSLAIWMLKHLIQKAESGR